MSGLIRQMLVRVDIFQVPPRWVLAIVNPKALEVIYMQMATDAQMKTVLGADAAAYGARPFPNGYVGGCAECGDAGGGEDV
jgi:hypothetical protein